MASLGPEEYRRQLERAGIPPEKPLHAVLMTGFLAAQEARDAVKDGAPQLAERVAHEAVLAVDAELGRLVWKHQLGLLLKGIMLGGSLLILGFLAGKLA